MIFHPKEFTVCMSNIKFVIDINLSITRYVSSALGG